MSIDAPRPRILLLGGIGLVLFGLFELVPPGVPPDAARMREASEAMASAGRAIRDCRAARGLGVDEAADVNGTGLIGVESSPMTTTLGSLEAKRTTTNPNVAGLLVRILSRAGVRRGDAIAVGASGSFPALVVAVLAACRILEAEPLVIYSLGASQWGANDPRFDGLDMLDCLGRKRGLSFRLIALAPGGEEDRGAELGPEGRNHISERLRGSGLPTLEGPELERDVARRVALYREAASGRRLGAFVNIGGSWANIGTDASVLHVGPGLAKVAGIPAASERGVLHEMAKAGVPVVHLLNIKGLAAAHGLPWDPVPLPGPGEGALYARSGNIPLKAGILFGIYALAAVFILRPSRSSKRPGRPGRSLNTCSGS
jgi:poly-gamma-glutamate system protein